MTILSAPAPLTQADASSSVQHPLKEKRRHLQETQGQIHHIDRIRRQLEQLSPSARHTSNRRYSNSSATSSWSVASNGSEGSLSSEIKGRELLVPLAGIAFVPATVQRGKDMHTKDDEAVDDDDEGPVKVYARRSSDTPVSEKLVRISVAEGGTENSEYREMTLDEAKTYLDEKKQVLEGEVSKLRDEVVSIARATLMEHLGQPEAGSGDTATPTDEQGQALNEEGLPFVDPIEAAREEGEGDRVAPLQPFVRDPMTREARRYWMDTVLTQLEDDEEEEHRIDLARTDAMQSLHSQKPPVRTTLHRRLSSAERPAPPKSVLKHTGPVPPPLPRFGSSGIRRGFLNLNPSSPAAEHSSDPVESIGYSETGEAFMTRSSSSSHWDGDSEKADGLVERMSRSVELPSRPAEQKKKKTVRIQSPARERNSRQADAGEERVARGKSARNAEDEDVEDEAKGILELLGLDAIKGHPQAAGLYEALKDSERMKELADKAETARVAALDKEREKEKDKRPAVGQSVVERPAGRERPGQEQGAKAVSAFKRGFLNGRPSEGAGGVLPAGPRISQGVSALERATQSEVGLEKERVEKGLKPAVPHARPSKAFAEKLEARQRGEEVKDGEGEGEEEETGARTSKVRFGKEANGEVAVEVGTAATASSKVLQREDDEVGDGEEDEGALDSIGLHVSDEYLDEDTVEALGYFSDEDYDPDIGLDPEDIQQSKPEFRSNGAEIGNEELRREYERIKATLGRQSQGLDEGSEDDEGDGFGQGRDLSMDGGEKGAKGVSHFKQNRVKRALSGQTARSSELGGRAGLENAENVGPSMLIPSIANVRYPKRGQEMVSGKELELEGQSDGDDDDLEEIMRLRLLQQDSAAKDNPSKRLQPTNAPPVVVSANGTEPPTTKKPSLFKSRMKGQAE